MLIMFVEGSFRTGTILFVRIIVRIIVRMWRLMSGLSPRETYAECTKAVSNEPLFEWLYMISAQHSDSRANQQLPAVRQMVWEGPSVHCQVNLQVGIPTTSRDYYTILTVTILSICYISIMNH